MSSNSVVRFNSTATKTRLGRLVQSNLRFVVQYAKRFRRLGVPLLDLIHEGNLGLIEAARRFDPAQSGTFQASALWWIRQAMMHLLAESSRTPDVELVGPDGGGRDRAARWRRFASRSNTRIRPPTGAEIREPATSDVEDFEVHLQNEGRKRRKARKARQGPAEVRGRRPACASPAQRAAQLPQLVAS